MQKNISSCINYLFVRVFWRDFEICSAASALRKTNTKNKARKSIWPSMLLLSFFIKGKYVLQQNPYILLRVLSLVVCINFRKQLWYFLGKTRWKCMNKTFAFKITFKFGPHFSYPLYQNLIYSNNERNMGIDCSFFFSVEIQCW